ncbi:hypothetical protein E2C01_057124 [Portunus trituberculatus]|uniref:Uncharacterized protein n=1 Tax=Portunus trituberculatus TaxID=210409 RepID=A0A5B7GZ74_PORTR|nr:hypothetical protein [Portunus trituberculatus]
MRYLSLTFHWNHEANIRLPVTSITICCGKLKHEGETFENTDLGVKVSPPHCPLNCNVMYKKPQILEARSPPGKASSRISSQELPADRQKGPPQVGQRIAERILALGTARVMGVPCSWESTLGPSAPARPDSGLDWTLAQAAAEGDEKGLRHGKRVNQSRD